MNLSDPAAMASPVRMVPHYRTRKSEKAMTGNAAESSAPPTPSGGRAGARGAIISPETVILQIKG